MAESNDSGSGSICSQESHYSSPISAVSTSNNSLGVWEPTTTSNTGLDLAELFAENIVAKVYRTAVAPLKREQSPPSHTVDKIIEAFPEYVPQEGPYAGQYVLREPEFWTCGFFPGTLHAILERATRYPQSLGWLKDQASWPKKTSNSESDNLAAFKTHLASLSRMWSKPLYPMATRTDTHDIGFIIMPALRVDWELTSNEASLAAIIRAARSLATRYVPGARAIRSWDLLLKKNVTIEGMDENLIVIIDSLCNLDLLFYASAHSGDSTLASIATFHAQTLKRTHLRTEALKPSSAHSYQGQLYSTCHVANIDPTNGNLKQHLTGQGYSTESTWARGQAWAVLGYAQTYMWTKDEGFLWVACGLAEYFLNRLETAPSCVERPSSNNPAQTIGRLVPLWDFDAPIEDSSSPLRDSSAGVIAANGMLILAQALAGIRQYTLAQRFQTAAIEIVQDVIDLSLAEEKAKFVQTDDMNDSIGMAIDVEDVVPGQHFEAILKNGTANNNEYARKRYSDHGLVYGDYYLVEFGNRLLRMGLV